VILRAAPWYVTFLIYILFYFIILFIYYALSPLLYTEGIYCDRTKSIFSGKSEPIGTKFTGRHRVMWQAPVQTLALSAKRAQKTAFCELFVTKTTHHFTHFLQAADFREI